jgi:CubicO group peptidase (beta-lactamase class C family)
LAAPPKQAIRLRHVLTMSAGLEWREADVAYTDARNDEGRLERSAEPVRLVLDRALVDAPGTRWNYSGGLTQVLAGVLVQATGRPLVEFAREALFAPLGIARFTWRRNAAGQENAASGLILLGGICFCIIFLLAGRRHIG